MDCCARCGDVEEAEGVVMGMMLFKGKGKKSDAQAAAAVAGGQQQQQGNEVQNAKGKIGPWCVYVGVCLCL